MSARPPLPDWAETFNSAAKARQRVVLQLEGGTREGHAWAFQYDGVARSWIALICPSGQSAMAMEGHLVRAIKGITIPESTP